MSNFKNMYTCICMVVILVIIMIVVIPRRYSALHRMHRFQMDFDTGGMSLSYETYLECKFVTGSVN